MAGGNASEWIVVTDDAKTLPAVEILTGRGFVTGKSGSGKSVLEGTPVSTAEGQQPIESVDAGEAVLSLNCHTGEQEYREVRATLCHTDDRLVHITLEDGTELVGTEDHSFLTTDGTGIVPIEGRLVEAGTWMPLSRRRPGPETDPREGGLRTDGASLQGPTPAQAARGPPTATRRNESSTVAGRASDVGGPDVEWKRVVAVERLDEERVVYDLDVRHTDTFLANGVFVHNSNTASVIVEELLESSYNMMIVDPEGEYYGLKERYELLHVGADDFCDVAVGPQHAEKLAEIALERNMPVILDVSEYFDGDEAKSLIRETVEHLFKKEKEARKPFLLVVEEMQEYLPQQGSSDELAELLERVAKRGRKRGLGVLGMSQRPASVDKDYITQCDWLVWHKLTWENDIQVASNILGAERAAEIEEFETGEAFLMTDWSDQVERVTFKQKRTHDAGATPGLESYERPDLHSVGEELIAELAGESTGTNGDTHADGDGTGHADGDRRGSGGGGGGAVGGGDPPAGGELDPASIVADVDVLGGVSVGAGGDGGVGGGGDGGVGAGGDSHGGAGVDLDIGAGGELEVLSDPDADPDDLRDALERIHRRNQLLEDEVHELKRILEEVDPGARGGPFASEGDDASERTGAGRASGRAPSPPSRPAVPQPPPDRSGVAGNLIEFGQLIVYLVRRVKFRLARLFRSGARNRR